MRKAIATGSVLAVLLGAAAGAGAQGVELDSLGDGTRLVYSECDEQVGRFLVPLWWLEAEVGALPEGTRFQVDPAGNVPINVVGLDCRLDDERVTDLFMVALVSPPPPNTGAGLVAVRRYTSLHRSAARFAQWCFGHVTRFGDVRSDTATVLAGSVSASDGLSSIEMTSSTAGVEQHAGAATIRHFTVADAAVHGLLEFTATAATMRVGTATLIVDRGTPGELAVAGFARRFYAPAFTFTFTGLTSCAPGLDRP